METPQQNRFRKLKPGKMLGDTSSDDIPVGLSPKLVAAGQSAGGITLERVAQLTVASGTTTGRYVSTASYTNWGDVEAEVAATWPGSEEVAQGFMGAYWASTDAGPEEEALFYAQVRTGDRMLSIQGYTSTVCNVELYANVTRPLTNDFLGTGWTFDANGSGFGEACQKVYDADHQTSAIPYRVNPNYMTVPNSAGEPDTGERLYQGWQWDREWAVARFNFVWK